MNLYHRAIVDAARRAVGAGCLEPNDARATVDNPLCGDRVSMELRMDGEHLAALAQRVRGCLLCEAAASVIGMRAPGEPVERLRGVGADLRRALAGGDQAGWAHWPEFDMFRPVAAYKSRHRCVLLPFECLVEMLDSVAPITPADDS